jgi:methylglyoxal synthase
VSEQTSSIEIAVIAHDGKKAEMVSFIKDYKELLEEKEVTLISTGTTGGHIARAGLNVKPYLSGPLGGDAEIAARVATGKTKMVIFFRDPLGKHPHEPDIAMLMRLCDVYNVPLATNPATAEHLMRGI